MKTEQIELSSSRAEADIPAGKSEKPYVFLTHGAGGDLNTPGLRSLSQGLAEGGHLSVRVDLPYRAADRKSPPLAARSVPGTIGIFEEVRGKWGANVAWVAGGRSYGGRVVSMCVTEGLQVAGLVFYSYPLHRPGDASDLRVEHWPKIEVPCLFLTGDHDPFCNLDALKRNLNRISGPVTLKVIEGAEHSLKVSGSRAPHGKARSEEQVLSELAPEVVAWMQGLAD